MSAADRCAVRRCRHTRDSHVPETVHYTAIGGFPASFEAHGLCTVSGCTCSGFTMMNSLQPTRPCRRCNEEFVPHGGERTCPDCCGERRNEPADAVTAFERAASEQRRGLPFYPSRHA